MFLVKVIGKVTSIAYDAVTGAIATKSLAYDSATGSDLVTQLNRPGLIPFVTGIIDETLDADPTSATSGWVDVSALDRVGFAAIADVTDGGASPSVTLTVEGCYDTDDGAVAVLFFDDAGGATKQGNEAISADTDGYRFWLDMDAAPKYIRVVATGANTDATNTVAITVRMQGIPA